MINKDEIRLTQFAKNGGCAVKIRPGALTHVLSQLKKSNDPRLLVGTETADDAGVYQINETTALIQTLDFFTPIVDDPYMFGQIAATNSLSDVYAMGGKPLTAMNIVAFPIDLLSAQVLADILKGGQDKVIEAGAVIVGGHTIHDSEPKYGLSVTGIVHPDQVWKNSGAQPGDILILTKAIGTGVLATAAKAEMFPEGCRASMDSMATLNRRAAEIAMNYTIHACTDITGFSLLGHLYEMASGSGVGMKVNSAAIPLLTDAADAAAMGLVPGGVYANREYFTTVRMDKSVPIHIQDLCFDPQTSGGLLFSVPPKDARELLIALQQAGTYQSAIIGEVTQEGKGEINVY